MEGGACRYSTVPPSCPAFLRSNKSLNKICRIFSSQLRDGRREAVPQLTHP